MKYKWLGGLVVALLLCACGGGHKMSPEELAHKLDSVKTLEIKEKLALQGIHLEESDNPLKMFYDSLDIQSLPISYSEDYVSFLPGFKPVPEEIVSYLEFEGRSPKAITLPQTIGARLLLLAADEQEHLYSLWLYSLVSPSTSSVFTPLRTKKIQPSIQITSSSTTQSPVTTRFICSTIRARPIRRA